jgi:hypothetical protein
MKYFTISVCFISVLFFAALVAAQNGAHSSYFDYTVTYNADGSAYVTPTAEVSGIDDVSGWAEGSYRPVCTVRPKVQLNGDADWVGGTRVALGRAVDQVRTGQAVYVPADGSTAGVNFVVEADVTCSGAPNPNYYRYPGLSDLWEWSAMDFNFWYLAGFVPAQTGPPYWYTYCTSADICPVTYGVASIKNFVDFADFATWKPQVKISTFSLHGVNPDGSFSFLLACPNGNQYATCGTKDASGWEGSPWLTKRNVYFQNLHWCSPVGAATYEYGPPAPRPCT